MKLSQWAKIQGIHYNTAYRWFYEGRIPNATQLDNGTILVDQSLKSTPNKDFSKVCVYTRVSSYDKKEDLNRQAERCIEFCIAKGYIIEKVVKEVASGMNDKRPKLIKLLESEPNHIIVEHKDRLTRFGFNYFEVLLRQNECQLTVINKDQTEQDDLMKDLISIITSFCCRLYGLRKGQNKAQKIKKELIEEVKVS